MVRSSGLLVPFLMCALSALTVLRAVPAVVSVTGAGQVDAVGLVDDLAGSDGDGAEDGGRLAGVALLGYATRLAVGDTVGRVRSRGARSQGDRSRTDDRIGPAAIALFRHP